MTKIIAYRLVPVLEGEHPPIVQHAMTPCLVTGKPCVHYWIGKAISPEGLAILEGADDKVTE